VTAAARSKLVVVTGLSGAGKSTALHALEDLSFFCIDNLPTPLLAETLAACDAGGIGMIAVGIDVRVRSFLSDVGGRLDAIRASAERDTSLVFLDASDEMLLRRFSETRRPHPLSAPMGAAATGAEGGAIVVLDGVRIERERLAPLRGRATHVIDTTGLSVHDLRRRIVADFGPGAGALPRMRTRFVSFGFRFGIPVDADVVLDVRFLDNPQFVEDLKRLSGADQAVVSYVLERDDTRKFVALALDLLRFALPRYEKEGKAYLTVAIGCTGGRHRSVVLADHLAAALGADTGLSITVVHRDIDRREAQRVLESDLVGGGPRGGAGRQ
jgi:RNase adapter protein RapZ